MDDDWRADAGLIITTGMFVIIFILTMFLATEAEEVAPAQVLTPAPVNSPAAALNFEVTPPVVRIKDIARVKEMRDNQLVGLGLVVGLDGTGDGTAGQASIEMTSNMLRQFGVYVDSQQLRFRNTAAVMVTATLPAAAREGDRLDVHVASISDARSLSGGILLQTPLQGADGRVYAVAQGVVSIGGQSSQQNRITRTHAASGMVIGGAIVEQELPVSPITDGKLTLVLATPDFSTAARVAAAINEAVGGNTAKALDHTTVEVVLPPAYVRNPVEFIAAVEELSVTPDTRARVVVNERTGTVVIGGHVRIAPVALSHGELSVRIAQPAETATDWETGWMMQMNGAGRERSIFLDGASVEDIVTGLNAIGAAPKDIISLLQALKAAGALFAELIVI